MLMEDQRLRVSENNVARRKFGRKRHAKSKMQKNAQCRGA